MTLDENGADGLIPIRTLPTDYYVHDEKQHALIGRKSNRIYRLGAKVKIRIVEADGFTGSSLFEMVGNESADLAGISFKRPHMGSDRGPRRDFGKKHGDKRGGGGKDERKGPKKYGPKKGGKKRK